MESESMPEKLGSFDLTCGQCGTGTSMAVYENSQGQRFTTCPSCSTNVRVYGIEEEV